MEKILLYIWQLPQNLLGLLVIKILKGQKRQMMIAGEVVVYYLIDHPWVQFSSQKGQYSICPSKNEGRETTMKHEAFGHGEQSKRWGPLYLPVVGLPSLIRNRIKLWFDKPSSWYYGFAPHAHLKAWPEKQADRLGGVVR